MVWRNFADFIAAFAMSRVKKSGKVFLKIVNIQNCAQTEKNEHLHIETAEFFFRFFHFFNKLRIFKFFLRY